MHVCYRTHIWQKKAASLRIFSFRAVKSGLQFQLIFECQIWIKLTFDKHTPVSMTLKWAQTATLILRRCWQHLTSKHTMTPQPWLVSSPLPGVGKLFLAASLGILPCSPVCTEAPFAGPSSVPLQRRCPAWHESAAGRGMAEASILHEQKGGNACRKRCYFYSGPADLFARNGRPQLGFKVSQSQCQVQKLLVFFSVFFLFPPPPSPQTCSFSACSNCSSCSLQK